MAQRKEDQAGYITWAAALELWKNIERETKTIIQLDGCVADVKGGKLVISGVISAYKWTAGGRGDLVSFVGYSFPNTLSSTFPGALFERLYTLHNYIDRAQKG